MKKILCSLLALLFLFFFSTTLAKTVSAASLKFDVPSVSTSVDQTFQVQVIVDSGGEELNGVDAYITFGDGSVVEAQSISAGTFFPTVLNNISTSKVSVHGLVDDPATSKSGTGTVATITFKALKEGSTTLVYDCDPSKNETSKVVKNDIDATNIIVCSENGSASVSVGGGGGTTPTPTPQPDTNGGGGTTDGGGSTGGGSTPSTLPESGVFDNVVKYAAPGIILFIIGLAVKLLI